MARSNVSLYVHRGIMLLQWKGNIEKSMGRQNRSLEVDVKCELADETLGTIEVQRAKLDRAVELFEKASKLAKSQSEMSHLYALLWRKSMLRENWALTCPQFRHWRSRMSCLRIIS